MTAESRDAFQDREYSQWLLAAESETQPTQEKSKVGQDGETLAELIRKTDQWCDDACEKWYGAERIRTPHFAEVLVPLRNGEREAEAKAIDLLKFNDERAPAIAKATVLEEMARQRLRSTGTVASELLESPSEHPMVRAAAASVLAEASPSKAKSILVPLLKDSSRLVRTSAARALLGSAALESLSPGERTLLDRALEEVRGEVMVANDRSGAHMSWAMICERLQRYGEAIQAYQTAIKVEPGTTGPRSNLANLLEQQAGNVSPADRERFLQRAGALRKQELPLLKRDALLAPNLGPIQYRYGLALYMDGQLEPAMKQLEKAVEIEPDNQDFQLAVKLLREKMEER